MTLLLALTLIVLLYVSFEAYVLSNRLDNVLVTVDRQNKQMDDLLNLIDKLQTIDHNSNNPVDEIKVENDDDADTTNIPNR